MANYQSAYAGAQHDLYTTKQTLIDLIYPIGAIYLSTTLVDPSIIFGGTWKRVEGKFLLGADNEYAAGSTGGSSTMSHTHTYAHTHTTPATTTGGHVLTINEMPSHGHIVRLHNQAGTQATAYAYNGATKTNSTWAKNTAVSWVGTTFNAAQSGAGDQCGGADQVGGNGSHTHSQVATTTNSQSSSTTSEASNIDNMPPYLAVYMWERIA